MYALAEHGRALGQVARGGFEGEEVFGGFGGGFGGGVAALGAEVADRGRSLKGSSQSLHRDR